MYFTPYVELVPLNNTQQNHTELKKHIDSNLVSKKN